MKYLLFVLPHAAVWTPFFLWARATGGTFLIWWAICTALSVSAGVVWDKKYGPGATNA